MPPDQPAESEQERAKRRVLVTCAHCGQKVTIRPSLLARGVRCPSCHKRLVPKQLTTGSQAALDADTAANLSDGSDVNATITDHGDDPAVDPDVTITHEPTEAGELPMAASATVTTDRIEAGATLSTDADSAAHATLRTLREEDSAGDDDSTGSTVPGYRLGRELGRGGLGLVRTAEQRAFGRDVAIKCLLPGSVTPKRLRKFRAEAAATAQLEHPNIIPVYDLVADRDGGIQLVMKQVSGVTWRQLLHPRTDDERERASRMQLEDHVEIMIKVGDAVAFAHARGILHRDIKPENVMVGAFGEVLLMDWGCAATFDDDRQYAYIPHAPRLVGMAGTPAYLAPEMASGQTGALDHRTDVYLLGGCLYEALCGSPPHRGSNVEAVLKRVRSGLVESPKSVAASKASKANKRDTRDVPDDLAAIAMKALAAKPDDRFQQADDLVRALRAWREHQEARELLRVARRHLRAAQAGDRTSADADFRRAVSGCEQARTLWPASPEAGPLLITAALAHAEHAASDEAHATALAQATVAAEVAADIGDEDLADKAKQLSARAERRLAAQRNRSRQLRRFRVGGLVAAGVALITLTISLVQITSQNTKISNALTAAEQARIAEAESRSEAERALDLATRSAAAERRSREEAEQARQDAESAAIMAERERQRAEVSLAATAQANASRVTSQSQAAQATARAEREAWQTRLDRARAWYDSGRELRDAKRYQAAAVAFLRSLAEAPPEFVPASVADPVTDADWAAGAWRALNDGGLLEAGPLVSIAIPAELGVPLAFGSSPTHLITHSAQGLHQVTNANGEHQAWLDMPGQWRLIGDHLVGLVGDDVVTYRRDGTRIAERTNPGGQQARLVHDTSHRHLLMTWAQGDGAAYATSAVTSRAWLPTHTGPEPDTWLSLSADANTAFTANGQGLLRWQLTNSETALSFAWPSSLGLNQTFAIDRNASTLYAGTESGLVIGLALDEDLQTRVIFNPDGGQVQALDWFETDRVLAVSGEAEMALINTGMSSPDRILVDPGRIIDRRGDMVLTWRERDRQAMIWPAGTRLINARTRQQLCTDIGIPAPTPLSEPPRRRSDRPEQVDAYAPLLQRLGYPGNRWPREGR